MNEWSSALQQNTHTINTLYHTDQCLTVNQFVFKNYKIGLEVNVPYTPERNENQNWYNV